MPTAPSVAADLPPHWPVPWLPWVLGLANPPSLSWTGGQDRYRSWGTWCPVTQLCSQLAGPCRQGTCRPGKAHPHPGPGSGQGTCRPGRAHPRPRPGRGQGTCQPGRERPRPGPRRQVPVGMDQSVLALGHAGRVPVYLDKRVLAPGWGAGHSTARLPGPRGQVQRCPVVTWSHSLVVPPSPGVLCPLPPQMCVHPPLQPGCRGAGGPQGRGAGGALLVASLSASTGSSWEPCPPRTAPTFPSDLARGSAS